MKRASRSRAQHTYNTVNSSATFGVSPTVNDWLTDSGEPDDNYDPQLLSMLDDVDEGLTVNADAVQALLDRLAELDPVGFDQVAVNNADGEDLTIMQFSALTGDQDRTQALVDDIEGLWYGDRSQVVEVSGEIIALEVTGAMTDGQSVSISKTDLSEDPVTGEDGSFEIPAGSGPRVLMVMNSPEGVALNIAPGYIVDGGDEAVNLSWRTCIRQLCRAAALLSQQQQGAVMAGNVMTLGYRKFREDKTTAFPVSLRGVTAGLAALSAQ